MKNRVIAGVLAALNIIGMLSGVSLCVCAESDTVNISTAKEFIEFSKNCVLDEWSYGRTVYLNEDIDFSEYEFSAIPSFGGTFNGKGHTISGIKLIQKGSHYGVFRYIRKNGKVLNLNVKGTFEGGGSKSHIGGIVGENDGVMENCTFDGSVSGENVIGGIVGFNTENGKILRCETSGSISGQNSTGGIAGENNGMICDSVNNAFVNTVYDEKEADSSDLETDKGALIESLKNKEEENEEESPLGHTDTGGIAGVSSGILQGCKNNAEVGYQHVGYNVGGISGRQSGFIIGCENFGKVQGRKDVGGISGQAEPYIVLSSSEGTLKNIQTELNRLNTMTDKFVMDTYNIGSEAEQYLSGISDYAKKAGDNAEILLNGGEDFVNDNISEINAEVAIISNTIDKLAPVFEKLEDGGEDLTEALNQIAETLEKIEVYAPELTDEINEIIASLAKISSAEKSIKKAISRLNRAENNLNSAVVFNNSDDVKKALDDMSAASKEIITAKGEAEKAIEEIEKILNSEANVFENIGVNVDKVVEQLKKVRENIGTVVAALKKISSDLDTIALNGNVDFSELKEAAQNMSDSMLYLEDGLHYVFTGLRDLGSGISNLYDKLADYTDNINEDINNTTSELSDGMTSLSYASEDIAEAMGELKTVIDDFSKEEVPEFVKFSDEFKEAGTNLFDSLSGISGEIDGLKDELSDGGDKTADDLRAIGNQFNLIMNLLTEEAEVLKSDGLSEIFLDVSDEDIENTRQGKIDESHNFGEIFADRNVGGIVGAMAIEYSKDPEDDIERPDTLNFTYRTKAVLKSCVNDGQIKGKKDCIGGTVGMAEIGTVYKCENYGDVESKDGSYVGGIAGKSEAAIRRSCSKSKIAGKRCVGGISGKGKSITASYSSANVSGEECIGAVCGDAEKDGVLYLNFYIDKGIGAVDGISYKEKAESISYDELKNKKVIPSRFISFTVTFIADGQIVETYDIEYGEETKRIKYPNIPCKEGCFGKWKKPECETVTENLEIECEYKPYITVISSEEKNDNGKLSLVLCEGSFTDEARVRLEINNEAVNEKIGAGTKTYRIEIANSDIAADDTVKIRILNEKKDKVTIWRLTNGEWEKVKVSRRGKYVITDGKGAENTFRVQCEKRNFVAVWLIICAAIIIFGGVLFKTKTQKAKNKE